MLCVMKFFYIFQHFSFQMGGWLWSFSGSPYVLSQINSKISFFCIVISLSILWVKSLLDLVAMFFLIYFA